MTLLELMIVLAILSMASSAMFSLVLMSFKTYWKGDVAIQVQQGGRLSLDRMTRDLRQARRLVNGVTPSVGLASFTFNTGCSTPQVSAVLPHFGNVTLTDGSTIYTLDANAFGVAPYDGAYVSYYLAATPDSARPNTTGPYLNRASYDLVANRITLSNVVSNITGLSLSAVGGCPTAVSREFTITLTAYQHQIGQGASSQMIVKEDVALRNQ